MYDAIEDPYTYKNSTVLVNKLDLRSQAELEAFALRREAEGVAVFFFGLVGAAAVDQRLGEMLPQGNVVRRKLKRFAQGSHTIVAVWHVGHHQRKGVGKFRIVSR